MTQKKYKLIPEAGYAIIRPIASEDFNKTKLATLKDERERISTGEVIAISKFAGSYENFGFQYSTEVKVGDTVVYIQYSDYPIKLNNEDLHIVRWDKITATIKEVV